MASEDHIGVFGWRRRSVPKGTVKTRFFFWVAHFLESNLD